MQSFLSVRSQTTRLMSWTTSQAMLTRIHVLTVFEISHRGVTRRIERALQHVVLLSLPTRCAGTLRCGCTRTARAWRSTAGSGKSRRCRLSSTNTTAAPTTSCKHRTAPPAGGPRLVQPTTATERPFVNHVSLHNWQIRGRHAVACQL